MAKIEITEAQAKLLKKAELAKEKEKRGWSKVKIWTRKAKEVLANEEIQKLMAKLELSVEVTEEEIDADIAKK